LKPSKKEEGQGDAPLGCLPLWGREGVTLQTAYKRKRITGNRVSTEPITGKIGKNYREVRFVKLRRCDTRMDPVKTCYYPF
jgi:hypothetical protein